MQFHERDLLYALNPLYLERGRDYLDADRVISAQALDRGAMVIGMVRGSGAKTYKQLIRLDRHRDGRLEITGQCSCPVGYNCKHVAAVLLSLARHRPAPPSAEVDSLRHELRYWLERLKSVEERAQEEAPAERLLFVLDLETRFSGSYLAVRTCKARRLKDGGFGTASRFSAGSRSSARFLRPADHAILRQLEAAENTLGGVYELHGAAGAATLDAMLESGRCFWRDPSGGALMRGEPLVSPLAWELESDGSQRVCASQASSSTQLLPLAPPWYLDPDYATCGPVETGLPAPVAETLAAAPPVSLDQAEALARALEAQFPDRRLPTPREPEVRRREDIAPVPCLRLYSAKDNLYDPRRVKAWDDVAELRFDYAGVSVHPWDEEPQLLLRKDDNLELILRQADAEIDHFERLMALGFEPDDSLSDEDSLALFQVRGESGWLDFMLQRLPELRGQGWRIDIDPSFRFQLSQPDAWYAELDETPGSEWFKLELGVEIGGERVNLLPPLADYLATLDPSEGWSGLRQQADDHPLPITLDDGRIIQLPLGRARRLIETLAELFDPDRLDAAGRLRLSRLHSTQLAELDSDGLQWRGGERLRELGKRLRDFSGIREVAPPSELNANLREYQRKGLAWLQFLREHGFGGILADDMGLGKTIQTLAHLLVEKQTGRATRPSLVVAPTSLLPNWAREARRFAPSLRLLTLQGAQRKSKFREIAGHDLVVTSYPLLSRDDAEHGAQHYHLLVLDEAQHVKNPRTKAARTARSLNAEHRLCLTGTPLENHLGELWSQFHFLMPGLLGDEREFRKLFRQPIEKHGDPARGHCLKRRIAPFLLRREKSQVAAELPPKSEIVNTVELAGAQRDLYETLRSAMHQRVRQEIDHKGLQRSHIVILDALIKLRQVCCDPRLVKLDTARGIRQSAKLELLSELLPEMVQEGRRILLFSQFTAMLGLIEERLGQLGLDYVKLTGRTRDRSAPIERFQNGEAPIFLISLKAGGTGLNLTAADTVIHYDPWWNPAVERQATDRAHRIGQDKPVFVYKLLSQGTVEEKIAEMQTHKQALADRLFSPDSGSATLDLDDLSALFEPLD